MEYPRWELIKRTGLRVSENERVSVQHGEVVVERLIVDRDVTEECRVELRKSKSSSGYYVGIIHDGRCVIALGVDELSKHIPRSNGYRIEKSPDSRVSFRVIHGGER